MSYITLQWVFVRYIINAMDSTYVLKWEQVWSGKRRLASRFMEMDIYREWVNILKSRIVSYTEPCP